MGDGDEVDLEHRVDHVHVLLLEQPAGHPPGVVDEHVESAVDRADPGVDGFRLERSMCTGRPGLVRRSPRPRRGRGAREREPPRRAASASPSARPMPRFAPVTSTVAPFRCISPSTHTRSGDSGRIPSARRAVVSKDAAGRRLCPARPPGRLRRGAGRRARAADPAAGSDRRGRPPTHVRDAASAARGVLHGGALGAAPPRPPPPPVAHREHRRRPHRHRRHGRRRGRASRGAAPTTPPSPAGRRRSPWRSPPPSSAEPWRSPTTVRAPGRGARAASFRSAPTGACGSRCWSACRPSAR